MSSSFPADDALAPTSVVSTCPTPLLHAQRLAAFYPGLTVRGVPGMARGLFAACAARAGAVLAREAAVAWEEEVSSAAAGGERLVRMWRHPVLSTRDVMAVAYQMAPFHGERAGPRVVGADGLELQAVTRYELLRATLAANSFAVSNGASSGGAGARGSGGAMHLSGERQLETLYEACGVSGRALFPALGLCNHSCDANARVSGPKLLTEPHVLAH